MRKTFLVLAAMLSSVCAMAQVWDAPEPGSTDYSHEQTIIWTRLVVDGQAVMPAEDGYSVGAFIGDECRAVSPSGYDFANDRNVFALHVVSLVDADETNAGIELKVYEATTGITYNAAVDETLMYMGDATIGQPSAPVVINLTTYSSYENKLSIQDPITIDRSSGRDVSINLLDYITINAAGDKITSLSTIPVIEWTSANESAIVMDGNTATAVGSTNVSGCGIVGNVGDHGTSLTTTILVTPFLKEVCGVEFTTNPIDVERGTSASLLDYINVIYSTGFDASGELTTTKVAAKDLTEAIEFEFRTTEEAGGYFNLNSTTGEIAAFSSTNETGYTVSVVIANTNWNAETVVRVTPLFVPLEDIVVNIDATVNGIQMSRLEPYTVTITTVPANATVEEGDISLYVVDNMIATAEATNDNGTAWDITATGVGNTTVWVNYGREHKEVALEVGADYRNPMGWEWLSLYTLPQSAALTPSSLSGTAFYGDGLLEIRSQEALTYNDPEWGWFGPLQEIGADCYKIYNVRSRTAEENVVYFGGKSTAEERHSVTLKQGWNWLHYPYYFNLEVGALDAMRFNPSEGDIILSQANGFAVYNDGQWIADNGFYLHYGKGYIYYANAEKTLNWTNELDRMLNSYKLPLNGSRGARAQQTTWSYDASQFSDNMPIIATIAGQEQLDANLTVGAFVNGECRGEGSVVSVQGQDYLFITVHGKPGEKVSFELSDGTQLDTQLSYSSMAGSINQPVMLSGSQINGINLMEAGTQTSTIYDVNGKPVCGSIETLPAGIYMISEGGVTRKVVK